MKKYMLPTLISLALAPTWLLAQEVATPPVVTPESPAESSTPAATETAETPVVTETAENKTADLMKKHQAYRNYMREQMEKLYQTDDPEERDRIREEMRQHQEEMQKEMWESRSMPGWGGEPNWGGEPPMWGGPRWGGPWGGGPGPRWGGANWDNPGPQWGGPSYYDMPPSRTGNTPNFPNRNFGGHQAKVEQHLENIEKTLQQIADTLAKQEKK
ncbi:MAG: hypothetical protein HC877_14210 [Thioploca sp.]|nr:hypothetical protein [Thioploca sp.]